MLNQWGSYKGLRGGKRCYGGQDPYGMGSTVSTVLPALATWPANNLAIYLPVYLEELTQVAQFWCANGATASGNVDMGLYTADGTQLSSIGSTAQSGTSTLQVFDVTDLLLSPGWYYVALALSSTVGTILGGGIVNAPQGRIGGLLEEVSAFPLPATATFATFTRTFNPRCGFTGSTVV